MTKTPSPDQFMGVAAAQEPVEPAAPAAVTLGDLFDVHAAYVWNTLRRLGVSPSDVEDLTHDVFLQVHARLGDYDPGRPVRPWLFGFAFRIASQHRRRAHRRRETQGEPDMAAHPGARADEQLALEDDRRMVQAALDAIDLDRRAVFILYEIDGVSMSEIANGLGIPANTAYSRLRVGRGEFRAAVQRLRSRRGEP
jgi:RNA polymerase sigma-70 factor (ECF subfamily)